MSSERPKLISLLVTGLGSSWSCKIQHNYVAFNQYWLTTEKILEVVDRKPSFNIQSIAELKIRPIINSLKNPTAKDINGMDSKLLKSLRELLAYPLTQTYKPVSTTGDIPNDLEVRTVCLMWRSLLPLLHLCYLYALWPLFPCLMCIVFVAWTALMSLPSSVHVCLFLLQLCALCLCNCFVFQTLCLGLL